VTAWHQVRRQNDIYADARWHGAAASQEQEHHESCRELAEEGPEAFARRAVVALMIGLDTNVLVRFLVVT
jgi:hypothetical protein